MKRRLPVVGIVVMVGLVAPAASVAQGGREGRGGGRGRGPAAPACTDIACDVQADWARSAQLIIGIADAMPEDKWSYKPTPPQRTFGEQVMHIVTTDLFLLGALGAKTPAPPINKAATSKGDVMAALKQSMAYGEAVLKEFNDQTLVERVPGLFMGPTASRLRIIYFSIAHSQDIYGQMAVYLRLNGVTPPASNRP
ncbi:MAG TPA: DinB family protein [Vicinamibacterales bacterium]|nr:DinB family protein [Vicinamibacterales bacterium]